MKVIQLSSCYFLLTLSLPATNTNHHHHPHSIQFANAFLQQGVQTKTAVLRRTRQQHYFYNDAGATLCSNSLNHHPSFIHNNLHPNSQRRFMPRIGSPSSTTKLYGFFDRFSRNRNNNDHEEDSNNNNEGENDTKNQTPRNDAKKKKQSSVDNHRGNIHSDDDVDDNGDGIEELTVRGKKLSSMSTSELEQAKQSLESLFAIPNDNQKQTKKRKRSISPTSDTSTTTATSSSMNANSNNGKGRNHSEDDERSNSSSGNNHNEEQRETILRTRDITLVGNAIPQPPLTAIARERRLKEISLLSTLTHSDDSVNELWALWIAEKGPAAATLLLRAEQLMSVESYDEAETILWSLIHQHGIHWAEPVNRLATLKYMQGRLEESKRLCEVVLQTKPWHFGALSGIVLVCTAMNDAPGARMWAEKRLPPFSSSRSPGDKREMWIHDAITDATKSLTEASKVGRNVDIGLEEMEFRKFRTQMQRLFLEENDNDSQGSTSTRIDSGTSSSFFGSDTPDAWQ